MNPTGTDTTISVDISEQFGIEVARNRLRMLSAAHKIPTILQARAGIAIKIASEMVLFRTKEHKRELTMSISVSQDDEVALVDLQFMAAFSTDIGANWVVAKWQLESISDVLTIENQGEFDLITMQLCHKRGRR